MTLFLGYSSFASASLPGSFPDMSGLGMTPPIDLRERVAEVLAPEVAPLDLASSIVLESQANHAAPLLRPTAEILAEVATPETVMRSFRRATAIDPADTHDDYPPLIDPDDRADAPLVVQLAEAIASRAWDEWEPDFEE